MMHRWVTGLLAIAVTALIITSVHQDIRITNLERQLLRIEQEYRAVITENHRLVRLNETSLRLLAQGGWNEVSSVGSSDY